MNNEKVKLTFDQANELLQSAQDEMCRSKEDVVPHMVCSNARKSMSKFLIGFLLNKGIENEESITLDSLFDQCKNINAKFDAFSLDMMNCSNVSHDANFCTDLRKVEECVNLAKNIKDMIEEPWPLSVHTK